MTPHLKWSVGQNVSHGFTMCPGWVDFHPLPYRGQLTKGSFGLESDTPISTGEGIECQFWTPWGRGDLTPLKSWLFTFGFLSCRKWPGLRFFWTPGGGVPPPPIAPRFGFDFGRFLADFGPILAIFGHFLTNLGTMGVGDGPLLPPPCSFWGGGTRPPINIGPTPIPPWVSSEVGPSPPWAAGCGIARPACHAGKGKKHSAGGATKK